MNILITGVAGFIGFHLALRLLSNGYNISGIDNVNNYYDTGLKRDRLLILANYEKFFFMEAGIENKAELEKLFKENEFDVVIHLAAQAGVRYSIENPDAYIQSNLVGHSNILDCCRHNNIGHLIYASSSSVYGLNTKMPFSTSDSVDHPVSLYAATKKANELMSHTYSHLYGLPTTGLRFFTVYGPWGRPDMALFKFTDAIAKGRPIDVYNYGKMSRDFTYIDDIVDSIVALLNVTPSGGSDWTPESGSPANSSAPYAVYNIGNGKPVRLLDFIMEIEKNLGMEAEKNMMPIQDGDVPATFASTSELVSVTGVEPKVDIEVGVKKFVDWYKDYYKG